MTVPDGLKNLAASRKAWFVAVLVYFGKVTWTQFVDLAKWLGGTFLVGTGLEAVGGGKSTTTAAP